MATLPSAATGTGTVARPQPPALRRVRRRRRPSGEPPPLPRHLSASGKWWLAASGAVVLAWIAVAVTGSVSLFDAADTRVLQALAQVRSPTLTRVALIAGALATPIAVYVLWVANFAILIVLRRWRHLFVWVGVGLVIVGLGSTMLTVLQRPRPYEVELIGRWAGYSMPSLPITVLTAFLVSMLYSAQDHPTDILAGAVLGVAVPLAAFRWLAPNDVFPVTYHRGRTAHLDVTGIRGEAIVRALQDQLGLLATSVKPFNLEGSGGSTPLRISVKSDAADGDTYVFAKLYAATHVRSDRWYKLGRTLLYGRLEDEQPFHSVRRLVQYEDYVLRLMDDAGLPVSHPLGIVEITPEREYLLVTEFIAGSREIGEAEIDDRIIDQGLSAVRRMWEIGLAHRDIKPANLLVRGGQLVIIDTAFAEVRPSPWRQAVDLANMMLVLALRTDAERVYQRARRQFTDEEIAEAFAATRGLTMPTQLRRMLRQQGRDLHAQFLALLPYRLPPVRIQLWSWRRVVLTIATLFGAFLGLMIAISMLGQPL
jgi:tRNA A-37 threonylcarbamoyl transferase component Bud32